MRTTCKYAGFLRLQTQNAITNTKTKNIIPPNAMPRAKGNAIPPVTSILRETESPESVIPPTTTLA